MRLDVSKDDDASTRDEAKLSENQQRLPMRAVPPRKCSLSACRFPLRLWIDVGAGVDVRCSFSVSTSSDISPFTVTISDIIFREVKNETKVLRSLQKKARNVCAVYI